MEEVVRLYVQTRTSAISDPGVRSESGNDSFPWEDPSTRIQSAFSRLHHRLGVHLFCNVIEPAVETVTGAVFDKMHIPSLANLLYKATLIRKEIMGGGDVTCCFCGAGVVLPECVLLLPNPYLTWLEDTDCCQPFSTYHSRNRDNPLWGTGESFAMHEGGASVLFAAWRLIHLNYFVDANLLLKRGPTTQEDLTRVLLSSIESCVSAKLPCTRKEQGSFDWLPNRVNLANTSL